MKNETYRAAFKVLSDMLREDKRPGSMYHAWQCSIAMSFYDALSSLGYRLPHLSEAANLAASRFLDHLTAQADYEEPQ